MPIQSYSKCLYDISVKNTKNIKSKTRLKLKPNHLNFCDYCFNVILCL